MSKAVSVGAKDKAEVEFRSPTRTLDNSEALATSVAGAVKLCGGAVGRSSIYKAMQRGELGFRKAGARRIILISELREWLQNLPSPASSRRLG